MYWLWCIYLSMLLVMNGGVVLHVYEYGMGGVGGVVLHVFECSVGGV